MAASIQSDVMKNLSRYWGYVLLLLIVAGWISGDVGPAILILASVVASVYFLFQAPMWCGARTRKDQFCRNNSRGLLVGCPQVRQHKWQSLGMIVHVSAWKDLCGKMFRGLGRQAATISALATLASALIAAIALAVA